MAEIKKYLDFDGLSTFWSKIKIAYSNADAIIEGKIVELDSAYKKADENLGKRIDDLTDTVGGNNINLLNTLNTLIGGDTGKSARTIASEEIANQLIPGSADESLNTLQEIAAWIQQHPDDVAAMNKSIEDNAKAIASNTTAIEDEVTARTNAISNLQTAVNDRVTISNYNTKISSLEGKDSNFETRIASLEATSGTQAAINAEAQARKDQDDKIEASVGLTADGSYSKPSNTNYIKDATTVMGAITALDSALKTHADSNVTSFQNEVTNRNNAITTAINGLNISNYATVSALDAVEEKVDAIGRITEEEIANLLAS